MMLATIFIAFLVSISAAPIEQLTPAGVTRLEEPRQFLVYNPQSQFQLQPEFKLQQPLLQPLTQLGKIQQPKEQQMVVFYQTPSLPPIQSSSPKQWQIFCDQFEGFINQIGAQVICGPPAQGGTEDGDDGKEKPPKVETNRDAENIPENMMLRTPASTIPLSGERHFYTIGGRPQFFGNFDVLQNPLHPIFSLQPLQPIKARSVIDPIEEIGKNDKNLIHHPASEPILLPLRASGEESVSAMENVEPGKAAKEFADFLLSQKALQPQPDQDLINPIGAGGPALEFVKLISEVKRESKPEVDMKDDKIEDPINYSAMDIDNPSIANAQPLAIAITGKNGLAQANPLSTAIVGKNGLAIAAPVATSIAGEFSDDENLKNNPINNEKIKVE